MNGKKGIRTSRFTSMLGWIVVVLSGFGAVTDWLNSLLDLAHRDELTAGAGLLFEYYIHVTGWLSAQLTVPAWAILALLALGVWSIRLILRQRKHLTDLSKALDAATTPVTPAPLELDSTDERVLFWVKLLYDKTSTGLGPTPTDVAKAADIKLSDVEAFVDVLKQAGLIRLKKLKSDPLDLTPKGREYFKPLEVKSRYDTFQINLFNNRI